MSTPTLAEVVKARRLLGRDKQVEQAKADVRKLLGSVEHYLSRCMEEVKGSADGQRFDDLLQLTRGKRFTLLFGGYLFEAEFIGIVSPGRMKDEKSAIPDRLEPAANIEPQGFKLGDNFICVGSITFPALRIDKNQGFFDIACDDDAIFRRKPVMRIETAVVMMIGIFAEIFRMGAFFMRMIFMVHGNMPHPFRCVAYLKFRIERKNARHPVKFEFHPGTGLDEQ